MPAVLIVDDDAHVATLIARIVRRRGCHAHVATSPVAALDLAASHPIDLVISDVQMPGLRGPELLARLHTIGVDCPVLFISGDASLATVEDSLTMPRALFLPKPFTPDELSDAIWAALAQR